MGRKMDSAVTFLQRVVLINSMWLLRIFVTISDGPGHFISIHVSTEVSWLFFHLPSSQVFPSGILVSGLVSCPTLLAGGYQSPLPDALPDPVGRHTLSTRIVINVPYNMRCWGCVKLWHKVPIIRYKIPPDFVEVLHGGRQVQLHTSEYVQQRLHIVKEDEKHKLVKILDCSGNCPNFSEAQTSLFALF